MADVTGYTKTKADSLLSAKADSSDLADYAKTADVPTKTSDLTNDSGFLTSVASTNISDATTVGKALLTAANEPAALGAIDACPAIPHSNSVLKSDNAGGATAATAGTDYLAPSALDDYAQTTNVVANTSGSNTIGGVCTVANGATAPAGLPEGTLIVEKSA